MLQQQESGGLENVLSRLLKVDKCIEYVKTIRECVDELARTEELVALKALGFEHEDLVDDRESSAESSDNNFSASESEDMTIEQSPDVDDPYDVLRQSQFNWFNFVEEMVNLNEPQLEKYYSLIMSSDKPLSEKKMIELSHQAYINDLQLRKFTEREATAFNGDIVTDSEEDDPDIYTKVSNLTSDCARELITKTRQRIYCRARYLKAKYISEKNFLSTKSSKHV